MSKQTTEHNEYGIQHPDDTVKWVKPQDSGVVKIMSPRSGYAMHVADPHGNESPENIAHLNDEYEKAARALEQTQHLPAGTIKPSFVVRRSVLTVYGETEAA